VGYRQPWDGHGWYVYVKRFGTIRAVGTEEVFRGVRYMRQKGDTIDPVVESEGVRFAEDAYEKLKDAAEALLREVEDDEPPGRTPYLPDERRALREALSAPEPVIVECFMCDAVQIGPLDECERCGSGVGLFPYEPGRRRGGVGATITVAPSPPTTPRQMPPPPPPPVASVRSAGPRQGPAAPDRGGPEATPARLREGPTRAVRPRRRVEV
jgi:hypothetical protein